MKKAVAAHDPGQKGILFLIDENRESLMFDCQDRPPRLKKDWHPKPFGDRRNWLFDRSLEYDILMLACEDVHAMPGDGNQGMFKFGLDAGYVRGVCDALWIPFTLVTPQKWQKAQALGGKHGPLGCSPEQERRARKKATARKAETKFPQHHPDEETADGMLLCDYMWSEIFGEVK